MSDFDVRLVAYAPGGARLGLLPEPLSLHAAFPHNDTGSLSVTYSSLAAGGEFLARGLEEGLEVAVEVADAERGWTEPDGGRFVLIQRKRDAVDESLTLTLTLPSYGWLLGKARNLETRGLLGGDHSESGKRPFYSATPGTIVGTFLRENAARDGVPVGMGFTAETDSAGAAWEKVSTIFYDVGMDLLTILRNLTDQGMADWRTRGRTLRLYNPDTVAATDRATGQSPVVLTLGRDVTEAPEDESLEEVVGRVLIRGEGGLTIVEDNPSAPTPWGRWEGFISQGGVSDEGTARALVQADLARGARLRGQYTRGLTFAGAKHLPLLDYEPGQWLRGPVAGGKLERVRLQQVTLTRDADGVGGNVILNDRLIEAELRRARRVTGIVGGATGGGSGGRPNPGPDMRPPAAPRGLVASSEAYIDQHGEAQAIIHLGWEPVTEYVGLGGVWDSTPGEPSQPVEGYGRATIVYAPHPDDETLRLTGYVSRCVERGDSLILVAVTDGGATGVKDILGMTTEEVEAARRAEQDAAWSALTAGRGTIMRLGLPDGGVRSADGLNAVRAIAEHFESQSIPEWPVEHYAACRIDDAHDDHRAVCEAIKAADVTIRRFSRPTSETGGMKYMPPESRERAARQAWEAYAEIGHRSVPKSFEQLEQRGYVSWITT